MKFSYASLLSLAYLANFAIAHGNDHADHADDETPGSGGEYVVLLEQDDKRTIEQVIADIGATKDEISWISNNTVFKAFTGNMSKHCVNQLSVQSGIKKYEQKIQFHAAAITTQEDAPWGLSRISKEGAVGANEDPLALQFPYTFDDAATGQGVDIYVVDTGVNVNHVDFNGRATFGFAFDDVLEDENGHGTHCAGTAASSTLGVAKGANIIAVKVLGADGSGDNGSIIRGLEFVIQRHQQQKEALGGDFRGSVVSMSLGSDQVSEALDDIVSLVSSEGIHVSVAAGNSAVDACNTSPALASRDTNVISVGAIDIGDNRADFSNFGECVTTYAPGVTVMSTFIDPADPINGQDNIINDLSGTSMACPHVSGLIAYYLSLFGGELGAEDTAAMKQLIINSSEQVNLAPIPGDPSIVATNKATSPQ